MKKLQIGFIGAGLIAHGHALALRALIEGNTVSDTQAVLAKVYDTDRSKAQILAEQHGFAAVADRPADLIDDPALNVVYICTPTASHKKYFLQAAAAGKHIFVEKPLAFTTAEIREMIAARRKTGVQAQVGLVLRFEPVFYYLKMLLARERGNFGPLLSFYFRSDQEWPLAGSFHDSSWRGNPGEAFAGCLFEHSIHDLDLIRHLFGEVSVLAGYTGYRSPQAGQGIEDTATVSFALAGGGTGNLTSLYHRIKGRDLRRLEIFFERAAITLDGFKVGGFDCRYRELTVEVTGQKARQISQAEVDETYYQSIGSPPLLYPTLVSAYRYQALSFLRSLRDGRATKPGLEEGLKAHRLIDAVYAGARREEALLKIQA